MTTILERVALSTCVLAAMCAADVLQVPFKLGIVGDAAAGLIVAPVRRTAVVTTAVVASSSANANAAAAANANAAAAAAKAAPVPGPPAIGTVVTTLPPGCTSTALNGVDYMRCGSTYYKASMMGSNLVFVVAQP